MRARVCGRRSAQERWLQTFQVPHAVNQDPDPIVRKDGPVEVDTIFTVHTSDPTLLPRSSAAGPSGDRRLCGLRSCGLRSVCAQGLREADQARGDSSDMHGVQREEMSRR